MGLQVIKGNYAYRLLYSKQIVQLNNIFLVFESNNTLHVTTLWKLKVISFFIDLLVSLKVRLFSFLNSSSTSLISHLCSSADFISRLSCWCFNYHTVSKYLISLLFKLSYQPKEQVRPQL